MSDVDPTPPTVHLRINGEKLKAGSGGTYDHIYPATGEVNARIPLADKQEIDLAVTKAHEAFLTWRKTPPAERRRLLQKLADLIEANAEEFARLGALDNGTPLAIAAGSPLLAAEWTRYYAGWADKITGELTGKPEDLGELGYTVAQPYGVVAIIITWNGPLISLAMKIPAALAAGNTVVVKPSELTPFAGELFMDLVEQAGIPAGVVNILPGTAEAGAQLVGHPLVKKVTFTGGPATATKILQGCAPDMKPAVLELGGKSAQIIFADADLDAACQHGTQFSLIVLSGQGCAFPTRMLIEDSVYDEVVERVKRIAESIVPGDPLEPGVVFGPVINEAAVERIVGMVERAKEQGATVLTGGRRLDRPGYYVEPTVLTDVDPDSEIAQNEVFGPVLCLFRFSTDEEAVAIANKTRYGLSSYIQTTNLNRALKVAAELDAGQTIINNANALEVSRPFGGFGLSGLGKEGGRDGLYEFLRVRAIGIKV
ncbi:aldehyde dehydrogenase family protein [Cryptosporangium aurantiacum]|uniref:Aldehyde dehydrogenase (NAD+) n=1 Tax=Cryptosporangium aurantiacum TaxID=134849 RepID=A0A1M7R552_9ACTN|nr:aldehyde dehydrogenase family protein [Cryptosporangium aurantiacum]SHN40040.1 aldehyde dehydrogenase (NAD+) [Cryptosporangium aurantiacum]